MSRLIKLITLFSVMLFAVFTLTACSTGKTTKFKKPDIKDDFCGVSMDYRYCKCAFHNDFCDDIGLSSGAANTYVRDAYNKYLDNEREVFGQQCKSAGGIYDGKGKCTYCEEPYVKSGNKCVKSEDATGENEEDNNESNSTAFVPDGPFNNDCSINESKFDGEWRKYSDFDNAIDYSARSWDAQQHLGIYEQIIDLKAQNFILQRDMEIDRQMRLALREYKAALVQNIKTNLLKSFWRLSYVTYTTIKSAKGLGESYSTVLTSAESIPRISAGLKVVQGVIPGNSSLAIDTNSVSGKVKSIGLNAALEAFDSMGDPVKIATQVFTDSRNAALPSADISPEEIEILRTQHLTNKALDQALTDSYKVNAERRKQLLENQRQIQLLEAEATSWEAKEKARVRGTLKADCKEQKQRFNDNETSFLNLFIKKAYAMEPAVYELGDYYIDYDKEEDGNYYLGDNLILSIYDTNGDGKDDMWLKFDDELYVTLEAYDTSGDGQADTFAELNREESIENLVEPELEIPKYDLDDNNKKNNNIEDTVIIYKEEDNKNYTWLVIVLGLLLGGYIYRKKKKSTSKSE